MWLGIEVKKENTTPKKLKIGHRFRTNEFGMPCINENKIWAIGSDRYEYIDLDKLYDLIKADLVEKV